MNALAFTAGALAGGLAWSLISYYVIRAFLDIEDAADGEHSHRNDKEA